MRRFSLIIPAHNEEAVIGRTLQSVLAGGFDGDLQILVVANGCTDTTAERARQLGPPVEVIETPRGNKTHALNLGDRAARHFPRAVMDADVTISPGTLQKVAEAFDQPGVHLVCPECCYVYRGWNPLLAGYYRLWQSLPYVRGDTVAKGFYAFDRELRARFTEFPQLVADDKFIRNLAAPAERRVAAGAGSTVQLPPTFSQLLRVKTRWTYGNLELAERCPELNTNDQEGHRGALRWLALRPWHWPSVPMFLFVYAVCHREAHRRWKQKRGTWERAERSRL